MAASSEVHVSFILSTFNKAAFLESILDNIREFIGPDDELIITDGGSSDATWEIIDKNSDIITAFVSEKDKGPAHGYNKALLMASGSLIMNINDDDYFYPDGVRQAIKVMDDHPEIEVLTFGGECRTYDAATGSYDVVWYQHLPDGLSLSGDIRNFMTFVQAGFMIIRRRIISLAGIFDTTVQATDTQYFSQLLLCDVNFKYLDTKVFRHTAYPHSSQNNVDGAYRDRVAILMRHGAWDEIHNYRFIDLRRAMGLDVGSRHYSKTIYNILLYLGFYVVRIISKVNKLFTGKTQNKYNSEPLWDWTIR